MSIFSFYVPKQKKYLLKYKSAPINSLYMPLNMLMPTHVNKYFTISFYLHLFHSFIYSYCKISCIDCAHKNIKKIKCDENKSNYLKAKKDLFIHFYLALFSFFSILGMENSFATEEYIPVQDYLRKNIVSLECKRDQEFVNMDTLSIKNLTEKISQQIKMKNSDNISESDLNIYIRSILKTRHLFPGKEHLIKDFYEVKDKLCALDNKIIGLIIVVDTLAYI